MPQLLPPRRSIDDYLANITASIKLRLIKNNYDKWVSFVKEATHEKSVNYHGNFSTSIAEELYDIAMKVTNEENLYALENQDIMQVIRETPANIREWSGIYLTALVNNSCVDELNIDVRDLSFLGYRLNSGVIRINTPAAKHTGTMASHGIIECNADICGTLMDYATGGMCFNNKSTLSFGNFASNIIAINNGIVSMHMGYKSSGRLFANFGIADNLGHSASGICLNNGYLVGFCNSGFEITAINLGPVTDFMGANAKRGVYMAKKMPAKGFMRNAMPETRCMSSTRIENWKNLQTAIQIILDEVSAIKMPITITRAKSKIEMIEGMIKLITKSSKDFNSPQDLNIYK